MVGTFTAVKGLYISPEFTPRIAPTLQELVGERVTEVLPSLQTLFLKGTLPLRHVPVAIGQFVELASHPVSVSGKEERSLIIALYFYRVFSLGVFYLLAAIVRNSHCSASETLVTIFSYHCDGDAHLYDTVPRRSGRAH
jgi:hypothetical protein